MCKFKPLKASTRWRRHNDLAGIINRIMVCRLRVSEEIQITDETYIAILKEHLEPWFKPLRLAFRRTTMFILFS